MEDIVDEYYAVARLSHSRERALSLGSYFKKDSKDKTADICSCENNNDSTDQEFTLESISTTFGHIRKEVQRDKTTGLVLCAVSKKEHQEVLISDNLHKHIDQTISQDKIEYSHKKIQYQTALFQAAKAKLIRDQEIELIEKIMADSEVCVNGNIPSAASKDKTSKSDKKTVNGGCRPKLGSLDDSVFYSSTESDKDIKSVLSTSHGKEDRFHDLEKVLEVSEVNADGFVRDRWKHGAGGKTRIISCISDESETFEDSKKFLSESDLCFEGGTSGAAMTSSSGRSPSMSNIHTVKRDAALHKEIFDQNGAEYFPRDNMASKMRKECIQRKQNNITEPEHGYRTPLQRKDAVIKQLRKELEESYKQLEQKQEEVKSLCENKEGDGWDSCKEKEEENCRLRKRLAELQSDFMKLQQEFSEKMSLLEETEASLDQIKTELDEREKYHKDTYLKMYEKGQKAALIEREEQLEELAMTNPKSVSTSELLEKLTHTQEELGRWQTLARRESYEGANTPVTETEALLKFMKDSMFHYLTDKDDCGVHLRAMVRMLGFTDAEKRKMIKLRKKVKKHPPEHYSGLILSP